MQDQVDINISCKGQDFLYGSSHVSSRHEGRCVIKTDEQKKLKTGYEMRRTSTPSIIKKLQGSRDVSASHFTGVNQKLVSGATKTLGRIPDNFLLLLFRLLPTRFINTREVARPGQL